MAVVIVVEVVEVVVRSDVLYSPVPITTTIRTNKVAIKDGVHIPIIKLGFRSD